MAPLSDSKLRWSFRIALGLVFCPIIITFLVRYASYLLNVVSFPYDWEATDGDHLNFAHRLAQGLPIYLSMKDGNVLNIYNPLYHVIVALLGGENAGLSFARSVACVFWLLIPVTLFFYARRQFGLFYGIVAAVIIALPPMARLLCDCVQVTPTSTMACLFLWSLVCAERCVKNGQTKWWLWLLAGALPAACFMAKQQGAIAAGSIGVWFLLMRVPFKKLLFVALGFVLFAGTFIAILEIQNSGHYLTTTILDVSKIITSDHAIASERLVRFFCRDAIAPTCCVVLSLLRTRGKPSALSIWQVSFLLHLPFLMSILGNLGGSDSYFLTAWITLVVGALALAKDMETSSTRRDVVLFFIVLALLHLAAMGHLSSYWIPQGNPLQLLLPLAFSQKLLFRWTVIAIAVWWGIGRVWGVRSPDRPPWQRGEIVLAALCLSIAVSGLRLHRDFGHMPAPNDEFRHMMAEYYDAVGAVAARSEHPLAFSNRSIGALVTQGVRVDEEACTYFNAWSNFPSFKRDAVLAQIRQRKFQLICRGVGKFPPSVASVIEANYDVAFEKPINFNLGVVGMAAVYVPK